MSIEDEMHEVMLDMLYGPEVIYVVMVTYNDSSMRCFCFSTEENLTTFVQIIEETGEENGIMQYAFFSSLLDVMMDTDYKFFTVGH